MKKHLGRILAMAALVVGVAASRAHAVADYVVYEDATIPGGGGANVQDPQGAWEAYYCFAAGNACYIDSRNNAPVSPAGGPYIYIVSGANVAYGGGGTAFITSGSNSTQVQTDLSAYAGGNLTFYLKSDRNLQVEIQYGDDGTGNPIHSSKVDVNSTGGAWTQVSIPLDAAHFGAGVDYTKIRVPFLIEIPTQYATESDISVDSIHWVAPAGITPAINPSSTRVNPGKHRLFVVDNVSNPTWDAGTLGSLDTTTGQAVVLTANSTIQTASLSATKNGLTGTSSVQVLSTNIDREYGLLAYEGMSAGVILGTGGNASLSPYQDTLGSSITSSDFTGDFHEGTFSEKFDANVVSGGYAGAAIQWTESSSIDMNEFYDGSLRFWFNAPNISAFVNNMNVSIRSVNVAAGSEYNVKMSNYYDFNAGGWQAVTIPIKDLAGAAPKTDLSRTVVLFNIGISAATGGTQSFYIDKLRWDTRTPGALSRINVTPGNVTIPKSLKQTFIATGYDAANVPVDIWPTWSAGSLGTLSRAQGDSTQLSASATPTSGGLTATQVVSGSATVTVADIAFTQSFNVYSDAGSGGQIGIANNQTSAMSLNGNHGTPTAPEGLTVMHASYTVAGSGGYATWFDYEVTGTRFMSAYSQGYLHFWVNTTRDLEVSIRSDNVDPNTNRAKYRLSELGVPLNGTWQEIWLSLNDFALREPTLDFSQMKVYFGIAAIQSELGDTYNQTFDVDDVKWYTADPHVPDPEKIYLGLKNKQSSSTGLVVTYDNDSTNRAVVYDQALAAMAYTYHTDTALSKKVLDAFLSKYNAAGAGFNGFASEYDRDTPSIVRNPDRTVGPNAWIMLAAIHYRAATGSTDYDGMIDGIGTWLRSLQDPDGGLEYGFTGSGGTPATYKSTENNFDAYSAFRAWANITGNAAYTTAANNIYTWLTTPSTAGGAWSVSDQRFIVGKLANGSPNTDYALDCYSWAALAINNGYQSVLDQAESLFVSTHAVDVNGLVVNGFDFSGTPGNGTSIPYGVVPDKDAVWLEGTGHMVVAYLYAGRQDKATQYLNELDKAVYTIAGGAQGMTYASNAGTAYWTGSLMDSTHAAISPMAWYLFAKWGFNPLQPLPAFDTVVKNISDNVVTGTVTWSTTVPAHWVRASQYLQFRVQGIDTRPWGIQIYTNNTDPSLPVRYVDPTPNTPNNADADPAGLMEILPGTTTIHHAIQMAWRVQNSTTTAPTIARPYDLISGAESPDSYSWFYFKDAATPAIDANNNGQLGDPVDGTPFTPGETYITVKTNAGIQTAGETFTPSMSPDYIYFEADFGTASANLTYSTTMILECFIQ